MSGSDTRKLGLLGGILDTVFLHQLALHVRLPYQYLDAKYLRLDMGGLEYNQSDISKPSFTVTSVYFSSGQSPKPAGHIIQDD